MSASCPGSMRELLNGKLAECHDSKVRQECRVAARKAARPLRHAGRAPQVAQQATRTTNVANRDICTLVFNGRLAAERIIEPHDGTEPVPSLRPYRTNSIVPALRSTFLVRRLASSQARAWVWVPSDSFAHHGL
jgi:hypothetical protein